MEIIMAQHADSSKLYVFDALQYKEPIAPGDKLIVDTIYGEATVTAVTGRVAITSQDKTSERIVIGQLNAYTPLKPVISHEVPKLSAGQKKQIVIEWCREKLGVTGPEELGLPF